MESWGATGSRSRGANEFSFEPQCDHPGGADDGIPRMRQNGIFVQGSKTERQDFMSKLNGGRLVSLRSGLKVFVAAVAVAVTAGVGSAQAQKPKNLPSLPLWAGTHGMRLGVMTRKPR